MSIPCGLFEGRLLIQCDPTAGPPPANAVLLISSLGEVAIVTTLAADRGWIFQQPEELLHAVHRRQWLEKRGPVYYRPSGMTNFYKADLVTPDE